MKKEVIAVKRDGTNVLFSYNRIVNAVLGAIVSIDYPDTDVAHKVATGVSLAVNKFTTISVEEISRTFKQQGNRLANGILML